MVRRWSYILGGLIAWAANFAGVYLFVSLEAQTSAADTSLWRVASVAWSLVCAAASGGVLALALRRLRPRAEATTVLMDQLAALGAGLGLVAIAFQTLPSLVA